MPIQFQCGGCGQTYRVNDQLAGRVAVCRHCGAKMTVPSAGGPSAPASPQPARPAQQPPQSPSIGFADEQEEAPSRAYAPQRSWTADERTSDADADYNNRSDDDDDGGDPSYPGGATDEEDDPQNMLSRFSPDEEPRGGRALRNERDESMLPPAVAHKLLPWVLVVVGFGLAAYLGVKHAMTMARPGLAVLVVIVAASLLLLAVWPFTVAGMRTSAKRLDFTLPRAHRLLVLGLIAIPTAAMAVGYTIGGGINGVIGWAIIGLLVMAGAAIVTLPTSIPRALMSVIMAALYFGASAAASMALAVGAGYVLGQVNVRLPWESKPNVTVAKQEEMPAAPAEATPAPPKE